MRDLQSASFFNTEIFESVLPSPSDDIVSDLLLFDEIDSTSTLLMNRMTHGSPVGATVIAARQTGGRGRSGNSWYSTHHLNLYISYAIRIEGDIVRRLPLVPLAAGIAAYEALGAQEIHNVLLKWPNDLMKNGKKIGGILCETPGIEGDGATAVVGMGINIGKQIFPDELRTIADYLDVSCETIGFRERVAAHWIVALYHWCQVIESNDISGLIERWKKCCEPFGRRVRVGERIGHTLDLDSDGRLLLKQDSGHICTVPGGMVEYLDETVK
ncbi:MAG: biotin--[acetyl-CoA-carboxylase] ligase [Deltaproteobacteria bacterium]|nr:biotin--[acetyl-CoA-carboxylase] ligase [Deltaproteobacteria bacterium]